MTIGTPFSSIVQLNMIGTLALFSVWMLNSGQCAELNSVEYSPFYDAIIFGDIAEIINDIDNNMNFQTEGKGNSENESDEEVESLLSEYQHYLEKAEKQRAKYLEKSKLKNKVPLLRHERFTKVKFPKTQNNNKNTKYYSSNIQMSQTPYKHPLFSNDLFSPMKIVPEESLLPFNKITWNENKMNDFTSNTHKSNNEMLSSCFCEENKFPCKCDCKQCLIPLEKKIGTYFEPSKSLSTDKFLTTSSNSYTNVGYLNENTEDNTENNLNIRVKFDIQLPKINDVLKKLFKSFSVNPTTIFENMDINDTVTPINISTPNLNFPVPLSIFTYGISKLHNYDYTPIHKISLHKKKKTHGNYQNKKHRSKFLSFHRGKGTPQNVLTSEVYFNDSNNHFNNGTKDTELNMQPNVTREPETSIAVNASDINSIDHVNISNTFTFVNVSNDEDNVVETDTTTVKISNTFSTLEQNETTEIPQFSRIKREEQIAIIYNDTMLINDLLKVKGLNSTSHDQETYKRVENKQQILDSDLLYWPNKNSNDSKNTINDYRNVQFSHNVNITVYTTNLNASWQKALSKINWTDIDIATSTFSSLVGKHANGILTFCSENRCQSIKCMEKVCVHRSCFVEDRHNQRGHCGATLNETDSTISMEPNLDVSFDIACELFETLQNQTLGFAYGKSTICINIKCITLVANKKSFTKTKCSKKQLDSEGHCQSLKNSKIVS